MGTPATQQLSLIAIFLSFRVPSGAPLMSHFQNLLYMATQVLIDFPLTVKAATLIFISGCGSVISSAKGGKSDFIELISFLGRANVRAFHENPNRIHTELTFINP